MNDLKTRLGRVPKALWYAIKCGLGADFPSRVEDGLAKSFEQLARLVKIAGVLGVLFFLATLVFDLPIYRECNAANRIVTVGGCDAFGNCGVAYENGVKGQHKKPVPGQIVCTKYEWKSGEGVSAKEKWESTWASFTD